MNTEIVETRVAEAEEPCRSCGSSCFYVTSFCNWFHCMHCGEAADEEHEECSVDPGMMAAEWDGNYKYRRHRPGDGYDTCRRCGDDIEVDD